VKGYLNKQKYKMLRKPRRSKGTKGWGEAEVAKMWWSAPKPVSNLQAEH